MNRRTKGFFGARGRLKEEQLLELASPKIVRRGLQYARTGRVSRLVADGSRLEAEVVGTRNEPYLVNLEHDGEEILSTCTCPFDWEPLCKHAVASLAAHFKIGQATLPESSPLTKLEQEEVEVRRRRGRTSGFRVRRLQGEGNFGIFEVRSPSGRLYETEIRSIEERINRCNCTDYAISSLGTCKHIEAVLTASRRRAGPKSKRARAGSPQPAQILVDYRDVPRIHLRLPERPTPAQRSLARDFFDTEGYLRKDPVIDLPGLLERARRIRKMIVYGDVVEFSGKLAQERQASVRREEVSRRILSGNGRIRGINADLYPYQVEGSAFLASGGRILLGDDMGLGKTLQAIAAMRILTDRGEVRRALVVCPASLKSQWASEIDRFATIESQIIQGSVPVRLEQYRRGAPITIINYELLLRDRAAVAELAPELLILDEAQRIRNWRTKTAAEVKGLSSRFVFVLTGTPIQNRLDDLYSVMQVVDQRILGPLWAYNERFVVRADNGRRILGYRNLDELRRRIAPVVLRRTKEEVQLQLPERIESRIGVELTPRQREFMDDAVARAARYAKIAERRPLTPEEEKRLFAAMQTARMACNAAGLVDKETVGSPKLDEFEQLVRDLCLARGRKVVVFSEWERFGRLAAQRAERHGIAYVRFHGTVPTAKRGSLIERFRDDPDCKLFITTDAGGLGLNLQFASTMINLDLPWNPSVLEQRIGRLHRIGQTDPVHLILLVTEDSFESGLERTLSAKRALFGAALDRGATEAAVEAPSSCLSAVREALFVLESEEPEEEPTVVETTPRDPETTEGEAPRPTGGEEPVTDRSPADGSASDAARKIAELLGPRVRRVLELPQGKLVAVVDRADQVVNETAKRLGMIPIEEQAAEAMMQLDEDSALASAQVLFERPAGTSREEAGRRRACMSVCRRKLDAAGMLADAELGAEAIEQAHAAMIALLRGLAADLEAEGDSDLPPARLLFEILVPRRILTIEESALVSRAGGLADAYKTSPQAPAPESVRAVVEDARALYQKYGASEAGAMAAAAGAVAPGRSP